MMLSFTVGLNISVLRICGSSAAFNKQKNIKIFFIIYPVILLILFSLSTNTILGTNFPASACSIIA